DDNGGTTESIPVLLRHLVFGETFTGDLNFAIEALSREFSKVIAVQHDSPLFPCGVEGYFQYRRLCSPEDKSRHIIGGLHTINLLVSEAGIPYGGGKGGYSRQCRDALPADLPLPVYLLCGAVIAGIGMYFVWVSFDSDSECSFYTRFFVGALLEGAGLTV